MFVVSYVMVVAFHPSLSLDRILIHRSYYHTQKELTSVNYLTREQLQFKLLDLIKQLHDIALHVSKRECKNSMAQMFCNEIAFIKKTLLSRFKKKIGSQFKELNNFQKMSYKQKNPIDYQNGHQPHLLIPSTQTINQEKTKNPKMRSNF